MARKDYLVEGRHFSTESEYSKALHDKRIIDRLRAQYNAGDRRIQEKIYKDLKQGEYHFYTDLGKDFCSEIEKKSNSASAKMENLVKMELVKMEKRRKLILAGCTILGTLCLTYFGLYSWYIYRTQSSYEQLSELKNKPVIGQNNEAINADAEQSGPLFSLDQNEMVVPEVLDEYKNLLIVNKRLIGWVKIDDTIIDYPVVQTDDNEYYLTHNLNQQYDKNGTIFLDKDCSVLKPSTNLIIYGHHMQSGRMFGNLDYYQDEEYYRKHPLIQFDTIYEKGTWQIMYVFRSRVFNEEDITFKYYQFIDAASELEFDSNMKEMAALSLYDTGVTAEYGDRLLTLSTCDYRESNGRFVVVAKKIKE